MTRVVLVDVSSCRSCAKPKRRLYYYLPTTTAQDRLPSEGRFLDSKVSSTTVLFTTTTAVLRYNLYQSSRNSRKQVVKTTVVGILLFLLRAVPYTALLAPADTTTAALLPAANSLAQLISQLLKQYH